MARSFPLAIVACGVSLLGCSTEPPADTGPLPSRVSWQLTRNGQPATCADLGASVVRVFLFGEGERVQTGTNDLGFPEYGAAWHDVACDGGGFEKVLSGTDSPDPSYDVSIRVLNDAQVNDPTDPWIVDMPTETLTAPFADDVRVDLANVDVQWFLVDGAGAPAPCSSGSELSFSVSPSANGAPAYPFHFEDRVPCEGSAGSTQMLVEPGVVELDSYLDRDATVAASALQVTTIPPTGTTASITIRIP